MAARKSAPNRGDFAAFLSIPTRWADNDIYGHMNNVVHYALFDTAVNSWLINKGLLVPGQSEVIGLVVETGCTYFSEIKFPDMVQAGLRVGHAGTSSVRYEIALFRNDDEQAAAEGFFVHVYVDANNRRPVPLPSAHRDALEELTKP